MYKFRTLKEGSDVSAFTNNYTWGGRFLRKYRLDELPQIINVLRGDMAVFGIRPQEERTINLYPVHVKERILSHKPGMLSPASIFFHDEERLLAYSENRAEDYWTKIYPLKLGLDFFYLRHRCFLLNLALVWMGLKILLGYAYRALRRHV